MHQDDVQILVRLLLYATGATRRRLAERLLDEKNAEEVWALLAATARSKGDPVLRARCVEVLGLAAAAADAHQAELILSTLLG